MLFHFFFPQLLIATNGPAHYIIIFLTLNLDFILLNFAFFLIVIYSLMLTSLLFFILHLKVTRIVFFSSLILLISSQCLFVSTLIFTATHPQYSEILLLLSQFLFFFIFLLHPLSYPSFYYFQLFPLALYFLLLIIDFYSLFIYYILSFFQLFIILILHFPLFLLFLSGVFK